MNIREAQEIAERTGPDTAQFWACFPSGRRLCTWINAHFGVFEVEDVYIPKGFLTVHDIEHKWPGLNCVPVKCTVVRNEAAAA